MSNITKAYSSVLHSQQTAYAEYLRSNKSVVIGDKDRRILLGETGPTPSLSASGVTDHWFKLDRFGNNFYDTLKLFMTVSAITYTPGVYKRLVNGFGLFFAERFQLWYAGKMVSEVTSDEAHIKMQMNNDADEYTLLCNSIGYGVSSGDRNNLSGASQSFILDLDEIIGVLCRPLPRHLLTNVDDFKLMVRIRPTADLIETDGTGATFSFSDFKLWYTLAQSNPLIDQLLMDEMNNNGPYGIQWDQIESIPQDYPCSAVTSANIRLNNLRDKEIVFMAVYARVAPTAADKMYSTYSSLISSWNLKSAMKYIHGAQFDITADQYRKAVLLNYKPANMDIFLTNNIFLISFAESLDKSFQENKAYQWYGSRTFLEDDVDLNLTFSSAFTGTVCIRSFRIKPTFLVNQQIIASQ